MNSILLVITFCHAEPSQSFKKNRIKLVTKVLHFYCCYLESLSLVTISVFLNLFQSAWTGFVFYSLRPFFSTPISVSLDITTNNYIFFIIKSTPQTSLHSSSPLTLHLTTASSSRQLWNLLDGYMMTKSHSLSLMGWTHSSFPPSFQDYPNRHLGKGKTWESRKEEIASCISSVLKASWQALSFYYTRIKNRDSFTQSFNIY